MPEPNQISLAFVSLETPVAEEKKNVIHIFMVATVEVRIFFLPYYHWVTKKML